MKNLQRHDGGRTFETILRVLQDELGYHIQYRVISARPWVPQGRERIFIAGFREATDFSFDRLSRLNVADWDKLKAEIAARRIRVVALDLPTSWQMTGQARDDIQGRILDAVNAMMLDMLAAIARKDYEDRRRRQAQGIEAAKAQGAYRGRPEKVERNASIVKLLNDGQSWSTIIAATGASRSTLARLVKRKEISR